jgi:hypothetical protein
LERTAIRDKFRTGLAEGWTFTSLKASTGPHNTTFQSAAKNQISTGDLQALRGDAQFMAFLREAMDGLAFAGFECADKSIQTAIVEMFGYWKHPRSVGSEWSKHENRYSVLADIEKSTELLDFEPAAAPNLPFPNTTKSTTKPDLKKRPRQPSPNNEAPRKRVRNANKKVEDQIKSSYRMVTIPITTFSELLDGLPQKFQDLLIKFLLPAHRRCVNVARAGCTMELLGQAASEPGIDSNIDLAKMFVNHYSNAARVENLSSMGQQRPCQQFGNIFVGQVVGSMKRAVPKLHKVRIFCCGFQ